MRTRPLAPSDTDAVAALLAATFPPHLRPYIAYAQPGTSSFLRSVLAEGAHSQDWWQVVAADATDHTLGFADFRLLPDNRTFLSYLCVEERARRRGIATTLIGGFLRNHPSARTIELDIFDGNAAAKQLYSNLGFADQSAQVWLVRPLPVPSTAALIDDGAAATQSYEAYGFSEFSVVLEDAAFRFGRIGASVLRCFTPDSFANDALLGHVRASLPDLREALTIASEAAAVPADARVVALSVRMSASASRVAERVKHVDAQAQPVGSQRDGGGAT